MVARTENINGKRVPEFTWERDKNKLIWMSVSRKSCAVKEGLQRRTGQGNVVSVVHAEYSSLGCLGCKSSALINTGFRSVRLRVDICIWGEYIFSGYFHCYIEKTNWTTQV